jgi:nucleotide-binding universal stress UspA family protein
MSARATVVEPGGEDHMALKDILVHLDDTRGHEARLALAVELARRHEAHLTAIFVVEPVSFSGLASPGGADFAQIEAIQELQEKHRTARLALGEELAAKFKAAADRAAISSEWRVVEDLAAEAVTLHARYADMVVLGQTDPDNRAFGPDVPEAVLLGSGRPALVVPYIGAADTAARRVLVAWSGTREAARALNDALPLLVDADQVTVLSINPERGIAGEGDVPAADIAHHLARHGIKAEAAYTVSEDIAIGDAILSRAADLGCDLIVMGGYGHSRARELVLGGATRNLLRHMTVPVLISH